MNTLYPLLSSEAILLNERSKMISKLILESLPLDKGADNQNLYMPMFNALDLIGKTTDQTRGDRSSST